MPRQRSLKNVDHIRHSLAHLLAAAVLERFPGAKLGIGPVIEHGFYYDFLFPKGRSLTEEDLPELQKIMRRLVKEKLPYTGRKVTAEGAKKLFKNQPFKLDLIKEYAKERRALTMYRTGNVFEDLCKGGHVKNTSEINPDAFMLTHLAGAYWRGSEKNPQLTRIYGLAFASKKELDAHLAVIEEAKRRDHRKIGKELNLFMFDDLVGPGLPIWLPNGTIIRQEIERFAEDAERRTGYERITTPHIAKEELFRTSGHLPYYAQSMYPPMKLDDGNYYLKAMNCPITHLIYRAEPRSYRDLPMRFAEYGTVYRNELSGTLAGLLRVRMLAMNDAHIYCRKDQIEEEFKAVIDLVLMYFKTFGLSRYWFRLSKWDPKHKEKYINEPKNWAMAEEAIRKILKRSGVRFEEVVDEAAFYGPKVDIQFTSVIGREETMSTIQLDFLAKERFGLSYRDAKGKENREVFVIHRAPLSTHERFTAFLIEHYAGAFPLWLSPVQVAVLPVGDRQSGYAEKVASVLKQNGIRAKFAEAAESLGKRIREAEVRKVPYILVIGEKEEQHKTVNVRHRGEKETREFRLSQFVEKAKKEIAEKK